MLDQGLAAAVYPLHLANLRSADLHPSSLPPLAAVISSSLSPSQWGTVPQQSVFSLSSGPGIVPSVRPSILPPLHVQAQLLPHTTPPTHHSAAMVPSSAANSYGPSDRRWIRLTIFFPPSPRLARSKRTASSPSMTASALPLYQLTRSLSFISSIVWTLSGSTALTFFSQRLKKQLSEAPLSRSIKELSIVKSLQGWYLHTSRCTTLSY
ncbi:hypothetical protein F5888DRAFT_1806515 [Russula emetica]|nr:hypothetical protein F5888DRAFT_1806515 [Russula emetica]